MPRTLVDDIAKIVGALGRVCREEGRPVIADVVSVARLGFEETSSDNWNGGTYGYTLQLEVPARTFARLGDGVDGIEKEILARIKRFTRLYPNEHVEGVIIAPSLEEQTPENVAKWKAAGTPSFWKEGTLRLFLSHVSSFKLEASAIGHSLSSYGISAFVAHEDIEPTNEWEDEIRLALATCDALACLLTSSFNESKWTDQEVGFAVGLGTLVVPVRLGLDPYGFMARYQGYSGFGKKPLELAEALAAILAKHQLTRARMAEALVISFENSTSYAEAKTRAKHLSLVQGWSNELAGRARRALTENDQIAGAYGVPTLVGQLLSTTFGRDA
jgi:hypothetical protein